MAVTLWPCSTCGAPGVHNLATRGYCGTHLAEVLRSFDPAVFVANGVGLQRGVLRPEFGPNWAELECVACAATWVGAIGESCGYCALSREIIERFQGARTLSPPDVEPADADYDVRMKAWAARLDRAVEAGVIDEHEAARAWRRAVADVAA